MIVDRKFSHKVSVQDRENEINKNKIGKLIEQNYVFLLLFESNHPFVLWPKIQLIICFVKLILFRLILETFGRQILLEVRSYLIALDLDLIRKVSINNQLRLKISYVSTNLQNTSLKIVS